MFEHFKTTALRIIWKSDATTIRLILATASLMWAVGAWVRPQSFDAIPYNSLEWVAFGLFGPKEWGAAFFLHFVGVVWRTFDPVHRVFWGLVVNTYGLVLWASVTLLLTWGLGRLSVTTATDWALCLFAAWALFKTGAPDDLVSP